MVCPCMCACVACVCAGVHVFRCVSERVCVGVFVWVCMCRCVRVQVCMCDRCQRGDGRNVTRSYIHVLNLRPHPPSALSIIGSMCFLFRTVCTL